MRTFQSASSSPSSSATRIASEYASSPVAQPADQMRSSRPRRAPSPISSGQHLLAQVGEELRVAEELGDLDQEAADQLLVLLRVARRGRPGSPRCRRAGRERSAAAAAAGSSAACSCRSRCRAAFAQLLEEGAQRPLLRRARRRVDAGRAGRGGAGRSAPARRRYRPCSARATAACRVSWRVSGSWITTVPPARLTLRAPAAPSDPSPGQDDGDQLLAE